MPDSPVGGRPNYRVETAKAATIVKVFNDIDIANANALGDALFRALESRRPLVIDLSDLVYVDSVGMHILLRTVQRAERSGTAAVLVATGLIRHVIEQVGLDRIVRVVPDVPAAMQALKTKSRSTAAQP